MRCTVFSFIFFCLFPFLSNAQKLEFNGDFLLFREAKTKQPVLIVNDSLVYKGFAMKRIAFKHSEYPARLNEYVFLNIGTKTYLVHDGCGPVLEYRNDSIVRINDNYIQRNQFGNVHFVYNNEIYFYGGYGLFTYKNILTKYNFIIKDWTEVQTYNEKPESRAGAYNFLIGENLYVFGGVTKDENEVSGMKRLDNKIWQLHLPTMQWKCSGTYNQSVIQVETKMIDFNSKKLYFMAQFFSEVDLKTKKIYTYRRTYFPKLLSSYLEGDNIIGVYGEGVKKFYFSYNIKEFKGKLISISDFMRPISETQNVLLYISITSIGLILLMIAFKKRLMNVAKPFKGIIYSKKRQSFSYKGKPILLEKQEQKILIYILDNFNQYVSLNEINQLFENNGNAETISAVVKRREQAVSGLLIKISKITGIEEDNLILERKNSEDKRIKDILLLPNLLKIEP